MISCNKAAAVVLGLFWAIATAHAQHCHVALRGYVREAATGEPLAYATVFVNEAGRGALSDENGYFSIADLCENTVYTVEVSHLECDHFTQIVRLAENTSVDFKLVHHNVLKEVVIVEKAVAPEATQTESLAEQKDLESTKGLNLSETLRKIPGVALLSSGGSIAKPVIQGLYGNRIAIVSDGVTLQSQQWGNDHAPEIDPFTADVIKVVKGAAGLRYGTGAMAGAVVLEPAPLREQAGADGWLSLNGFSNGLAVAASGLLNWKPRRGGMTYRIQSTLKRSGNLRAPHYWLGNTGAGEWNLAATAGWKKGNWKQTLTASRYAQDFGILRAAHTGSYDDLIAAIQSDTPRNNINLFTYDIDRPKQEVRHYTLKYRAEWRLDDWWKLSGQYSFQYNRRREFDRGRAGTTAGDQAQVSFQLWSNTLDVALEHLPIRHWQGGAGVQLLQQLNFVSKGGFIPDYLSWGGSLWATERWRRYPVPWEFEAGLRVDYWGGHVTTTGNGSRDLDERLSFANVSASTGGLYHLTEKAVLKLNTGYAWRPPHVNELYARGVHHGAGRYEQGNPDLKPEKAWNSNLGVEWESSSFTASFSVFRNQVTDFIYLDQPRDSVVVTIRGPFPAYFYAQSDAVLQGAEAKVSFKLVSQLRGEAQASLLRGSRKSPSGAGSESGFVRDWLPLMPADRIQYGLKWMFRKPNLATGAGESFIRISATSVWRQTRIPAEGLTKPAPPGFTLLGLDAGHTIQLKQRSKREGSPPALLELGLNVQNLTNVAYREYLDLFRYYADLPGINAGLRAKYIF